MRRLILIVLLVLFPLQVSWATVAHYREHIEAHCEAVQHADAHGAKTTAADDTFGTSGHSEAAPSHDHFHLPGFLGVPSGFSTMAMGSWRLKYREADSRYRSQSVRPPERPQWPMLA